MISASILGLRTRFIPVVKASQPVVCDTCTGKTINLCAFPAGESSFCVNSPKSSAFCREASSTGAYYACPEHTEEKYVENYLFLLPQSVCLDSGEASHVEWQDSKNLHFFIS